MPPASLRRWRWRGKVSNRLSAASLYDSSAARLSNYFTAWGPSSKPCLPVVHDNCSQYIPGSAQGCGIKNRKVPGAEGTWVGASGSWLFSPKFGPSKGETRGKKEHPTVGQCPPQEDPAVSTKITLAQLHMRYCPCSQIPKNVVAKVLGREGGGFCAGDEISSRVQRRSWSSVQRPGRKIHICRRFINCRAKCSTDIFKTWGH